MKFFRVLSLTLGLIGFALVQLNGQSCNAPSISCYPENDSNNTNCSGDLELDASGGAANGWDWGGNNTDSYICISNPGMYSVTVTCNNGATDVASVTVITYYADTDNDGFGDPNNTILGCDGMVPADHVLDNTDCNDNDANIGSMNTDADCDGVITSEDCDDTDASNTNSNVNDADCDGVITSEDCDDTDASNTNSNVNDADCDGVITSEDCDDTDASNTNSNVNDADCDGVITSEDCDDTDASNTNSNVNDADCDGVITSEDCDDTDASNTNTNVNDADCDGVVTSEDCDDNDPSNTNTNINDGDCDGVVTSEDCDDTDASNTNSNVNDADCDGVITSEDCDDTDASNTNSNVNDADCDGVITSEDCDDSDPSNTNSNVNDGDCDGVVTSEDCDDSDPSNTNSNVNDADCDGVITAEDCDDNDASNTNTNINDADCDGVITSEDCDDNDPFVVTTNTNDADCDGVPTGIDCDDSDASNTNSNANDGDCDGVPTNIDCNDADPNVTNTNVNDADCDGVPTSIDCDDNDASNTNTNVNDADCDGVVTSEDCDDNDASNTDSNANDGDCDGVITSEDCDDNDASNTNSNVNDADCDGVITSEDCDDNDASNTNSNVNDADCDGVNSTDDCDDSDPLVGGPTLWYIDEDGDGYSGSTSTACDRPAFGFFLSELLGTGDCNDLDVNINPGVIEIGCNNIDDDCNSTTSDFVDGDGDGFSCDVDCDDTDPSINPNAVEICNNVDDNCDGNIDDGAIAPTINITSSNGNTLTCAVTSLTLTASGSTTTGGSLNYSWAVTAGGPIDVTSNNQITVSNPGTYEVSVSDNSNGCQTIVDFQVIENNNLPSAVLNTPGQLTCTNTSVTLNAVGSTVGNTGAILGYTWSTGATTSAIDVTSPGTYIVTVTDQFSCSDTASTIVSANTTPPILSIAAAQDTICSGESTTLTVTAPNVTTPIWSTNQSGFSISTPSLTTTTSYVATVTSNVNGCTSSSSIVVAVNPNPVANAVVNDNDICVGQTINLNQQTPGLSCQWTTPTLVSGCSITSTPATNTTYTVTVTDVNNCTNTDQVSVTVRPRPNVSIALNDMSGTANNDGIICEGEQTTLIASATNSTIQTYAWSNGASANSTTVSPSVPGTNYVVTVTNTFGCTNVISQNIAVNSLPNPTLTIVENSGIASNDGIICEGYSGGFIQANAGSNANPISYSWDDDGMPGFSNSSQYPISNNTSAATSSYNVNVNVSDGNNCSETSASLPVTVCRPPAVDFSLGGVLFLFTERDIQFEGIISAPGFCGGADCSITNWQWDFGDGITGSGQMPPVVVYSTEGNKTVRITVQSSCGCSNTFLRDVFVRSIDDCQAIITVNGQEENVVEECLGAGIIYDIDNQSVGRKLASGDNEVIIQMDWILSRFEFDNNGMEIILDNNQITANGSFPNYNIQGLVTTTAGIDPLEQSFNLEFKSPGNYRLTHSILDNSGCSKSEPPVEFKIKETPTATFSKDEIEICFGDDLLASINDNAAVNPDVNINTTPSDDTTIVVNIDGELIPYGNSYFLSNITEDLLISINSTEYNVGSACTNDTDDFLEVTVIKPIELTSSEFICDDEGLTVESLTLQFEGARKETDERFQINSIFLQDDPNNAAFRFNFDNVTVNEGEPIDFDNFTNFSGDLFSDWEMLPDTNYVLEVLADSAPTMCNNNQIILNLICDCTTDFGELADLGSDIDGCTNAPILIRYDSTEVENFPSNASRHLIISTATSIESISDVLTSYPIEDDFVVEINAIDLPYEVETQYNAFVYIGEAVNNIPTFLNQCDLTSDFFRSFTFHQAPLSNGIISFVGRDNFCNNSFDVPIGIGTKLVGSSVDITMVNDGEEFPLVTNYRDSLFNADILIPFSDTITIRVDESITYPISGGSLTCTDSYSKDLFIKDDSAPNQYPVILWQGDNANPDFAGNRGHILALELFDPTTDQLKNPNEGPDDLCFQWGKTILPFDILPIQEIYIVNQEDPFLQSNNESINGQFLFAGNDPQLNQIIETPEIEDDLSYFWVDTWKKSDDPTCSAKAIDPEGITGRTDVAGNNLPYDPYFFCTTRNYLNVDGPPIFGFRNGEFDGNSMVVFPNPNQGSFTLEVVGEWIGEYTYQITDMSGREIITNNFSKETRTKTIEISEGGLTPGMYLIKVTNNFGASQLTKVIVY